MYGTLQWSCLFKTLHHHFPLSPCKGRKVSVQRIKTHSPLHWFSFVSLYIVSYIWVSRGTLPSWGQGRGLCGGAGRRGRRGKKVSTKDAGQRRQPPGPNTSSLNDGPQLPDCFLRKIHENPAWRELALWYPAPTACHTISLAIADDDRFFNEEDEDEDDADDQDDDEEEQRIWGL